MSDKTELYTLLDRIGIAHHQAGSQAWWEVIQRSGTPFIKSINESTSLVLFIWQDPQGNEHTSTTASVLLDVNSLTDHHSWYPKCLHRVPETDVWLGQLEVDSRWRGSYSFIPIKQHQLPEVARESQLDSRESQRKWWMEVAGNQIADDLNLLPTLVSGWGMSSPLHLPYAEKEEGWKEWEQGRLKAIPVDQVHTVDWAEEMLENQRTCWLFSTAIGDAPLVILLDGQKWSAASGTLSVLQYLTETKAIAPAHYLLIPSIDGKTRWKELGCDHSFWQAMVNNLFPLVQIQLSNSSRSISSYVVAGQSLGGLSALYAGLVFPDYFSKVISLSGSFWWPEEERMRDSRANESNDIVVNSLADQILQNRFGVAHLKVFMTVGVGEGDMHFYNDVMCNAIKQRGGVVHYDKVYGGHDWLSWRSSLIDGLRHLIPATS
ncbi:enterochelin esterase [Marinomonas posidonica]|uniref:Esterase n=1 Tax=Marinomonas posidonica (strain CECT 7376 / NCIMB 14433 / IVIA-Po-181) TaxID=491952 RepID=F6CU78_MARPP|nr:enterochelin esterase [Marinomonas posidonica]AEF55197.1 esterase [Marinomonas posidonica IVIA-Po-181]